MALHDALTDLPNRVLLRERLQHSLEAVRRGDCRVSILLLDLDRFKEINDTLGHSTGDALLQAVVGRLRTCATEADVVARLGGDEFAILNIADEAASEAAALAEKIQAALSTPFDLDHHQVLIGTSIGIAIGPAHGTDPDELMRFADLALYQAKSDGRGTHCFFEPEMDQLVQSRRDLERDLRNALVNGELVLHYQPLVDLRTSRICGFEALLRWRHPVRGMMSPAEFIPVAEDTGLIDPIGEWVLRTACAEAAGWPAYIKVAVNLSPSQFRRRQLVAAVSAALANSGIAPKRLEIEITETVMLRDDEVTFSALSQLRDLGVQIALDDFGTGFSSLSSLRKFPFDRIKIDRTFVSELSHASVDALAIVRSVVQLAAGLGKSTTAEGVETKEQMETVRAMGCSEMQGYYYSRPKPASEIARMLSHESTQAASAA
jgi:diguanylate cyclase (GGDEF)-like protein